MNYLHIYWKKYRIRFFMALFFLSLEALVDLMQPALMSRIIDQGVAHSNLSIIEKYGLVMLLITLFGAFCACTRNILSVFVSQKFAQDLRKDLYIKIQNLTQPQIDRFGHATLITRLTNDVTRVQTFANGMMRIMMKAPLVGIGSLIMAISLNPKLSLILLGIAPIIALLIYLNMKVSYPYFRKVQRALDHVNRSMQEYLSGIRVVKVFNRSSYEQGRFDKNNEQLGHLSATASKIGSIFGPLINLSVNIGIIALLWFGGLGVNNGSMHVGSIIAFTNYMMQLLFAIMMVNNAFNMLVRARASAERIGEVMVTKPDMYFPNEMKAEPGYNEREALQFNHVSFSFAEKASHKPVLSDVHFKIYRRETIGIIGPIASGKSTLANLILRFYDPDQGSIVLGGKNLKRYNEEVLHRKVSIVPQRSLLFSGTIIENIRWGNEKATDEEVIEAARIADADKFIQALPDGYYSMIGQGGVNLSGGQKQRISIARAIIRKPELLILDDATSAVDAQTDKRIRTHLKKTVQQLTCVIISQKVSSIMDADRILVLNHGKIEAIGTHAELIKKSPFYQNVCALQLMKGAKSHG
ncbi:ABC transporter ATP-binding protein [Sporolactobacillus kofuensis]|uniref:ABC transporter ATP-binding protein n=1 Tax=Sporolactobacillus kofuensis TaxID=269672 RepID=A0ABW1WH54_9BACL|nr:ABC transporter ATP-binding protein [Sporolactobacillus kofuensis]MCO7176224.1 ABC transporter ATP-binding protein/permease [Sporolactobacillus kofuensis]